MKKILMMSLVIILLFSCKPEEDPCSKGFLAHYDFMQEKFDKLISQNEGVLNKEQFKSSLENFLKDYEGVKCVRDKKVLNPTKEVAELLKELNSKDSISIKVVFSKVIRTKAVYGIDNRVEAQESQNLNFRRWSHSSASQIRFSEVDKNLKILSPTLGKSMSLCPGEDYFEQLTAARCSGFLVAPDLLITAGHCMENEDDCSQNFWTFDYFKGVSKLDPTKSYRCKNIVKQVLNETTGIDYAIVRLEREVKGRKFFRLRTQGKISSKANLVVIGNPSGLPTKVADGGKVRQNKEKDFFHTNLDTFAGNSGSVVLDVNTGVVEGLLVRGDDDYVVVDGPEGKRCRKTNICPENGCLGEEVVRITSVKGIPFIKSESDILNGILFKKSFPEANIISSLQMNAYSYGDYLISGRKFLERCAIVIADSEKFTSKWESSEVYDCENRKGLTKTIDTFKELLFQK